jgi:hypothetical protein
MDTCGLERVERFRIKLNENSFASQKNTLTSSLPQRCRAVGTYGSGNDTLVTHKPSLHRILAWVHVAHGRFNAIVSRHVLL